jgi:ribosome biogenesis GTPase
MSETNDNLIALGWGPFFEKAWAEWADTGYKPARVASQVRSHFWVAFGGGDTRPARTSGRMRHHAASLAEMPVVGDWVAAEDPPGGGQVVIHGVLPRKSKFSRKVIGVRSQEQVLVSNIDTAFLVMGLDGDYNTRRLERYLATAYESGAVPVVILNKSDVASDIKTDLEECNASAPGADVVAISATTGAGVKVLKKHLIAGRTIVLLGSSGAGKSTLANRLLGEDVQAVQEVKGTLDRGQHTTVGRQMFRLPGGALLIDTPGLREMQLWNVKAGVDEAFSDIVELAKGCRFRDCRHGAEPGCAVKAAVDSEDLSEERWESYCKLKKEVAYLDRRMDKKAAKEHQKQVKTIALQIKKMPKRGRTGNV